MVLVDAPLVLALVVVVLVAGAVGADELLLEPPQANVRTASAKVAIWIVALMGMDSRCAERPAQSSRSVHTVAESCAIRAARFPTRRRGPRVTRSTIIPA